MTKKLTKVKKHTILLYLMLISGIANAQLVVNAVVTDETCPGYGALSLSVSNADPSVPVVYKVYLMPEETIPVWNSTESMVPALQDGNYLIVATQQVNGNTVTGQANATINSLYIPVAFFVDNSASACNDNGEMTITVTAGNPVSYEIVSGPVTAPPQPSNIFTNIPPGNYEIRVVDECGNGFTATQSFTAEETVLTIGEPEFQGPSSAASCNTLNISYTISTSNASGIAYPINISLITTAPDGTTETTTRTITSGNASLLVVNEQITYYPSPYQVSFTVTDPCGTVYTSDSTVNRPVQAVASTTQVSCNGQSLSISTSGMVSPYTIAFTTTPAGFAPGSFNASYPGPYTTTAIFGAANNPVPLGSYSGTVTDACGRTAPFSRTVGTPQAQPVISTLNNNCETQLGRILVSLPFSSLETATLTSAPSAFTGQVPENMTGSINNEGTFRFFNIPPGAYTFDFTDSCGNTYENIEAIVPEFSPTPPNFSVQPDCTEGLGTVMIDLGVTAVTVTAAPSGFPHPLPYNGSSNIFQGSFSMDALPPGNYTFSVNTQCENGHIQTVEVQPLTVTNNSVQITPTCSDFSISVNYASNAENTVSFWLQRYNEETGSWENPSNGTPYAGNEELTSSNAFPISTGQPVGGLNYIGEFRIMKQQTSFASGNSGNTQKYCTEEVTEFEFFNELNITGIYNQTCVGESFDIQINTTGVSPTFELISKNGDTSFYLDNNTSNIFPGLESALYVVKVTDACGEFRVEQFNVADLPPLITASIAEDLGYCSNTGASGTFSLSEQNSAVLGDVDPDIAIITYHISQQDADQGINPLPTQYTSGPATIYARVEWVVNPLCYGTSSFELIFGEPFELAMNDTWGLCGSEPVTITADPGYASYVWSGGETTESITVTEPGEYTVTVTNEGGCETTKTVSAIIISQPLITEVDVRDWTDNDNSITVMIDQPDIAGYEFSLDGINYQASPEFTDVTAGLYTVYVRDRFGCNPPNEKEVIMATYPKFFSPNGDGHNDTWRIAFATMEPGLNVQIFNRYGKVLTTFGATSPGWDGTFQGAGLPADDYWFVITRNNGKEYRGHFSMLR
jgi:gliding motility-associated-like protein